MIENYRKTCKYLTYLERLLVLASAITDCVPIWGYPFMRFTKKSKFFDPPPPLSTTVQFEGTSLPDCGRPNFYHPQPPPHPQVRIF